MSFERLLFANEDARKRLQDDFFREPELGEPHLDPLSLLPVVHQPIFELDRFDTELVAIFYDSPGPDTVNFHLVFRDEVIHWSPDIDERYREIRREKYGRTTDIESIRIRILADGRPFIDFPFDYSLTPIYSGSLHYGFRGIPWTSGSVFSSSWNHLLDQLGRPSSPIIRFFGGYRVVVPAVVQEGTREDTESFVPI